MKPKTPAPGKKGQAERTATKGKAPEGARAPYHHGALKAALLRAAEDILLGDGIAGLTLRETARRAGVSHAAPKNHFGDIKGLLSDLAAVGFQRLGARMQEALSSTPEAIKAMDGIGRAYVGFARDNPGLFHLMYRSEMLDFSRPALTAAISEISGALRTAVAARQVARNVELTTPLDRVAAVAAAWCLVHGYATLLIDRRLDPMLAFVPGEDKAAILLEAVLAGVKPPAP